MDTVKTKIASLTEEINQWSHDYHVLGLPTVSDAVYDQAYRELLTLEKQYPQYALPYSPTKRVGERPETEYRKVLRDTPMLSLENVFTPEEFKTWLNDTEMKLRKELNLKEATLANYVVEPKYDGLAVMLTYTDGVLTGASTRGDGYVGEDILRNVKTIPEIPLKLIPKVDWVASSIPHVLEVLGEIYFTKPHFEAVNANLEKEGKVLFKTPRNAAAGTIRLLDSRIVKERRLSFTAYEIGKVVYQDNQKPTPFTDHIHNMRWLSYASIPVTTNSRTVTTYEQVIEAYNDLLANRNTNPIPMDGCVIKLSDLEYRKLLNQNDHSPNWAIAFKFPPIENIATLEGITYQIGRTGLIVPVGNISPTNIDGVTVTNVTFHNPTFLEKSGVRLNDKISVIRSGDVIPKYNGIYQTDRLNPPIPRIRYCPCCNTKLERGAELVYCPNENCKEQQIQKLIYYASRQCMNILNFGEQYIRSLYELGALCDIRDFYKLNKATLMQLEGVGEGQAERLLASIERSKTTTKANFIAGLGIPTIGKKKAHLIPEILTVLKIDSDGFKRPTLSVFESKLSPVSLKALGDWLDKDNHLQLIHDLRQVLIFEDSNQGSVDTPYLNKRICVTGSFPTELFANRMKALNFIKYLGAIPVDAVNSKTDILMVGDNPGSKYDKAVSLKITILKLEDIVKLIETYGWKA